MPLKWNKRGFFLHMFIESFFRGRSPATDKIIKPTEMWQHRQNKNKKKGSGQGGKKKKEERKREK